MTSFSKIALATVLAVLPLPSNARGGDNPASRVRVREDGDTVEVAGARPRSRVRSVEGRAGIGITLIDITPDLRTHFGAPRDGGSMIGGVEKDSPGSRAGLEVGDIVTSLDGERVASARELAREVRRRDAGETVRVEIVRDRATRTVNVTIAERPARDGGLGPAEIGDFGRDMGRMGRKLGRDIAREMRIHPFHFDFDTDALALPGREDVRRLKERLEQLETRLKELEERRRR